ncbi:MAG: hypothetical protein ABIV50_15835 [Opitutus sp.]
MTVTKPLTSTGPAPAAGVPRMGKRTLASGARASVIRIGTLGAVSEANVGINLADVVAAGGLSTQPSFQVPPLWEGDVTLPPATDARPRRLVVRENELYFKATPQPEEFLPIARRLVYADIVDLPAPVT